MPTRIYFPSFVYFFFGLTMFLLVLTALTGQLASFLPLVAFVVLLCGLMLLLTSYRITVHATGIAFFRLYGRCLADLEFSQFDGVEISSHTRTNLNLSRFLQGATLVRTLPVSGRSFARRLSAVLEAAGVPHELENIGASWVIRMKKTPVP